MKGLIVILSCFMIAFVFKMIEKLSNFVKGGRLELPAYRKEARHGYKEAIDRYKYLDE